MYILNKYVCNICISDIAIHDPISCNLVMWNLSCEYGPYSLTCFTPAAAARSESRQNHTRVCTDSHKLPGSLKMIRGKNQCKLSKKSAEKTVKHKLTGPQTGTYSTQRVPTPCVKSV